MAYQTKENETTFPTMIYGDQRLIWGKLVTPKAIRAQTWLKLSLLPDYFTLLESKMLIFTGEKPILFETQEIHVPIRAVLAYHLLPPFEYEPDFNPDETNRVMTPVTAVCGVFRFDGKRRISMLADSAAALQAGHDAYFPLYNATITQLAVPGSQKITVPYALLRSAATTIAVP